MMMSSLVQQRPSSRQPDSNRLMSNKSSGEQTCQYGIKLIADSSSAPTSTSTSVSTSTSKAAVSTTTATATTTTTATTTSSSASSTLNESDANENDNDQQQVNLAQAASSGNNYVYLNQVFDQDHTSVMLQVQNSYPNLDHNHHDHQHQHQHQHHHHRQRLSSYNSNRQADSAQLQLIDNPLAEGLDSGPEINQTSYRSENQNSHNSNNDMQQIVDSDRQGSRLCSSYGTGDGLSSESSHLSQEETFSSSSSSAPPNNQPTPLYLSHDSPATDLNHHHHHHHHHQHQHQHQQHQHQQTSTSQQHYLSSSGTAALDGCCEQSQYQATSIADTCYEQQYISDRFYDQHLNPYVSELIESQLHPAAPNQQQHSPDNNYRPPDYMASNVLHDPHNHHHNNHHHHHHHHQAHHSHHNQVQLSSYHTGSNQQQYSNKNQLIVSHNYQQVGERCDAQQSIAHHQQHQQQHQHNPNQGHLHQLYDQQLHEESPTRAETNQTSNYSSSSTTIINEQHPEVALGYTSLQQLSLSCENYQSSDHQVSTTSISTNLLSSQTKINEQVTTSMDNNKLRSATSAKGRRGRPRKKGSRSKSKVNGKLWEFIRDLLLNERTNPSFIRWERREDGVFKFVQSDKVAKMWGERKQNPKMTYEKLSRAMRYYYKSRVLLPVFGRRLVYKFGPNATGWLPQVADPALSLSAGHS